MARARTRRSDEFELACPVHGVLARGPVERAATDTVILDSSVPVGAQRGSRHPAGAIPRLRRSWPSGRLRKLLQVHKKLLNAQRVDRMVFPLGMEQADIKKLLASSAARPR